MKSLHPDQVTINYYLNLIKHAIAGFSIFYQNYRPEHQSEEFIESAHQLIDKYQQEIIDQSIKPNHLRDNVAIKLLCQNATLLLSEYFSHMFRTSGYFDKYKMKTD